MTGFKSGVGPREDAGEGAVVGVWSVEGWVVEADEERGWWLFI